MPAITICVFLSIYSYIFSVFSFKTLPTLLVLVKNAIELSGAKVLTQIFLFFCWCVCVTRALSPEINRTGVLEITSNIFAIFFIPE